jgi:hypothetical protein
MILKHFPKKNTAVTQLSNLLPHVVILLKGETEIQRASKAQSEKKKVWYVCVCVHICTPEGRVASWARKSMVLISKINNTRDKSLSAQMV